MRAATWVGGRSGDGVTGGNFIQERLVKKGRHRRFEEARSMKRAIEVIAEPCPECGADPEDDHASWCMYEATKDDELEESGLSED
jgi:hypothetical protein